MRTYRIIVHGVFPPIQSVNGPLKRGFYTARTVVAESREVAALAAFRAVSDTSRLQRVVADAALPAPELAVDEYVDLGPGHIEDVPEQGFIFYDESESDLSPGYYVIK